MRIESQQKSPWPMATLLEVLCGTGFYLWHRLRRCDPKKIKRMLTSFIQKHLK
ncbi:MAG: hypothetical protein F6K37_27685 [Moorea sp. SIO4E2]|uniref:hypothetical protein n=1 Tax=Moorena sp. SIO4E2 TaxID=2607826 RepID=UPI0013BC01AC|nr:hypothetical protein [Moorena sp. SIO4E2]NEQ09589.1 hypothetical protein [Moorena sp. SIO4E2]